MWVNDSDIELTEIQEENVDYNIETQILATERTEIVQNVLNQMQKGDALLLTLYYMEDNSIKDIVKITGLNESNVKVKLFRARNRFKEMILKSNELKLIVSTK
ncbi:MAG TPA: sigma factor-like helix-turn-helix DNA-binding protein [Bacteroidales bacterium]|nr:sigma factor-like helix-turn-helix DNA-binding protein [Bacteroidales bacterium]